MPKQLTRLTLLQALLKINRMQRWYSNLEGNLDGAPPDEKKLWKRLRKGIMPALKGVAATLRAKIRNADVNLFIPSKKLLITLTDMPASVSMAKHCIESAKQHGEDHNLEILPAVSKFESRSFFIRHHLTWCRNSKTADSLAKMGCFASHFKIWLRCMDLGEPVIALEHDAVFHAPIPTLKFRHVFMLGAPGYETWFHPCDKKITDYPNDLLVGSHAYAITPEGAHRLVKAAKEELLFPVDLFIRKELVSILYYTPYPIGFDNTWGSSIRFPESKDKENFDTLWKSCEHTPRYPISSHAQLTREVSTEKITSHPTAMPKQLTRLTLLQALLKINRMQRWYSNLENNLDGAPPDEKKLWARLRKDIVPALKFVAATQRVKIRSTGVNLSVFGHKPVIPSKKLLITLTDMPASVRMAKRCIESAKQHGENHNLEILPEANKLESRDFFIRHHLTWCWWAGGDTLAAMGCFASHFKLWLRCMDLGEPVIVLKHNALFRAPIPTLKFRHVLILSGPRNATITSSVFAACKKGIVFYPHDCLLGMGAYAITPEGAHRLVKAAKEELLRPVDRFIRKELVSILYYTPYPIE